MTPAEISVDFARTLRLAGLPVPITAEEDLLRALVVLGVEDPELVFDAGLATLVKRREDAELYRRVFEAYFFRVQVAIEVAHEEVLGLDDEEPSSGEDGEERPGRVVRYSALERLRASDLRTLVPEERVEALRLIEGFRVQPPTRRSLRYRPRPDGRDLDLARTVKSSLATGGELIERRYRAHPQRHRHVVFVVDVSGSMRPYAEAMLRLAWAARRGLGDVEVFTLGTRLARVTRAIDHRDPDEALRRLGAEVEDFAGGTKLGAGLAEFVARYGARGVARRALVVVLSDGWDRGDPVLMSAAMGRLRLLAHRIVWVNPLAASSEYQPLARGMAAALPHVDLLVPGESVRSLEEVARILSREGAGDARGDRAGASVA
jgi:uncharacterized protein with von Willebrand factor type A (vWA) domain